MEQSKEEIRLGRFISLVLRHNPSAAGITLDENGWADVESLLAGMRKAGKKIDIEILERIVRENNKQRYSFNDDHTKIRANQGHSLDVDVQLKKENPPEKLYHGTATRFLDSIKKQGITKQGRKYVHLSVDQKTAWQVGSRHGKPAALLLDTTKMCQDGYQFYVSENGIWMCEQVPWRYILDVKMKTED